MGCVNKPSTDDVLSWFKLLFEQSSPMLQLMVDSPDRTKLRLLAPLALVKILAKWIDLNLPMLPQGKVISVNDIPVYPGYEHAIVLYHQDFLASGNPDMIAKLRLVPPFYWPEDGCIVETPVISSAMDFERLVKFWPDKNTYN